MIAWEVAALAMMGGIVAAMLLGLPVAVAFLLVNAVAAWVFMGGLMGLDTLVQNIPPSVTSFALVPVPLFVVMGELFFHTGLAMRVFDALDKVMGRVRARLSYLTVTGGTLFATLSGSSMANTAMLGTLMVPEAERRGYKPYIVTGPIIATGSLAMIIPPSSLAVLLGSLARVDVGQILIAGVVPGLLLALLFVLTIRLSVALDPAAAPAYDAPRPPVREVLLALARDVLPMGLVIFSVIGLILLGWATPTESAAFGCLSVALLAALKGTLTREAMLRSLRGAVSVTAMMLLIILGSTAFSQLLAFSGASAGITGWAAGLGLGPTGLLVAMLLVLILLGMFMDQLSIMLLTIPIFFPLATLAGFDPIWFGVVMLLALELSLATPPFGLLLFVMVGVAPKGTTLGQVAVASLPYIACTLVLIALMTAFPGIALWLPRTIAG